MSSKISWDIISIYWCDVVEYKTGAIILHLTCYTKDFGHCEGPILRSDIIELMLIFFQLIRSQFIKYISFLNENESQY